MGTGFSLEGCWRRLDAFGNDVFHKVNHAIAVTPLVVIPADQLEEFVVQLDATARVEDGAA